MHPTKFEILSMHIAHIIVLTCHDVGTCTCAPISLYCMSAHVLVHLLSHSCMPAHALVHLFDILICQPIYLCTYFTLLYLGTCTCAPISHYCMSAHVLVHHISVLVWRHMYLCTYFSHSGMPAYVLVHLVSTCTCAPISH
jgi:hypothetical protein